MIKSKIVFFFILGILIINLIPAEFANAAPIMPPTPLIKEINQAGDNRYQPLIKGINQPGVEVMIYIDGTYEGSAQQVKKDNFSEEYSYQVKKALNYGQHWIMAIAKDRTSLVLSIPAQTYIQVSPIPAPLIIEPNYKTVGPNPEIRGEAVSARVIHIYVDDQYQGYTKITADQIATSSFSFKVKTDLVLGNHSAYVKAEDKFGNISESSKLIYFRVEPSLPAPTLITPVIKRPAGIFITGLTKNVAKVKVYADRKLMGEINIINHPSGTANFAYNLTKNLTTGRHLVYTTAIDNKGKESHWSNVIGVIIGKVTETPKPQITPVAAAETKPSLPATTELVDVRPATNQSVNTEPAPMENQSAQIEEVPQSAITDKEVEDLLKQGIASKTEETGLINENKAGQSKIQWNLVIFIIFLLGVIIWIFWVNRELIKERREQEAIEKSKPDNKNDDLKF